MIPVVELAPDIRDSWNCLAKYPLSSTLLIVPGAPLVMPFTTNNMSTDDLIDFGVCIVYIASGYDIAGYLGTSFLPYRLLVVALLRLKQETES